jgi:hypothetical protein
MTIQQQMQRFQYFTYFCVINDFVRNEEDRHAVACILCACACIRALCG